MIDTNQIMKCGFVFSVFLMQLITITRLRADVPVQPGVFFVSAYSASGTHTDYDMAREAADAYATANKWTGSVLILKPSANVTCDAASLPSLGYPSTTSIIGAGSGTSTILKSPKCAPSPATFSHNDSPNGALSRGWYQGFTVDANHVDRAACEMYGMQLTTLLDVACGNAAANADHELEFGNLDPNEVGWMDNLYIYGLQTFDTSARGSGAMLTPVWTLSSLSAILVTSRGTTPYSAIYVRAQLTGPDLLSCSSMPTLTLTLNNEGLVTGATVTNGGYCQRTQHIYIVVQDGPPVVYGMKFSNTADSHVWNPRATSSATYGESWLSGSPNNSIYNEQPSGNQLIQITDNGNGNRHISPVFTNPVGYAAGVYSQNGTFQNALLNWDDPSVTTGSGYFVGNDPRVFQDWVIADSRCGSGSSKNFTPIATKEGLPSTSNPIPHGLKLQNIEACDGTKSEHWAIVGP